MSITDKEKIEAVLKKLDVEIDAMLSVLTSDDFGLQMAKQVYAQASFLYRVLSPLKVDAGTSYLSLKYIRELMDMFAGGPTSLPSGPEYQEDCNAAIDYYKSLGGDFDATMNRFNKERDAG